MASTPYDRSHGFRDYQVTNPTSPLPGNWVDDELDAVSNSVDSLIAVNLVSMDTEGNLRSGIVGENELEPGLFDEIEQDLHDSVAVDLAAASASATSAQASMLAAQESADSAASSAGTAAGAIALAMQALADAQFHLQQAMDAATGASNSEINASNSANHAEEDANRAEIAQQKAFQWAELLAGPVEPAPPGWPEAVDDGMFSAKWWAIRARDYATGGGEPGGGGVVGASDLSRLMPYDLYINNFYPAGLVAGTDVANGASHPLSEFYSTLAEAQVQFPVATALTDEIDWCAWQTAIEYAYVNFTDAFWDALDLNMATATFRASGTYIVNKSIQVYLASATIWGSGSSPFTHGGNHVIGGTSVRYNGPAGTEDDPVFLFDANGIGAAMAPEHGKNPVPAGGVIFRMYDMMLFGDEGTDFTLSPDTCGANFVVGIFVRNGSFCEVARCNLGHGLYDGIWGCSQMFFNIRNNYFYGIYRDAIAIQAFTGDFSTTVWIDDNEFGLTGRYAILLNFDGAVEPAPSVRRNSIESAYPAGWYWSHPDYWVQGFVGVPIVHINGTFGMYSENRYEGDPAAPMWGTTLLVGVANVRLLANRWGSLILSGLAGDRYTPDYVTFRASHDCVDITDKRNFNCPTPENTTTGCMTLFIDSHQGLVVIPDGGGWSSSLDHCFRDSYITVVTVPTVMGTYGSLIEGVATAEPVATFVNNLVAQNTYVHFTSRGPMLFLDGGGAQGIFGHVRTEGTNFVAPWAATTNYYATLTGGADGKWICPATYNGCWYECIESGVSGATEPAWPIGDGTTVVDGTVTWRFLGALSKIVPGANRSDNFEGGHRSVHRHWLSPYPNDPSDGIFFVGDYSYNNLPDSIENVAWVCVESGIPGTWVPAYGGGGGGGGGSADLGAEIINNSGSLQSVPSNNNQPVTFDTVLQDDAFFADLPSLPTRLTIAEDGWYAVQGTVRFGTAGAASNTLREVFIILNGDINLQYGKQAGTVAPGIGINMTASAVMHLIAGDYLELYVFQTSGVSQTLAQAAGVLPRLAISKVGGGGGGGGGGTPGGADTQVQFNDGGAFGGDSGFVYDKTNKAIGLTGIAYFGSDYGNSVRIGYDPAGGDSSAGGMGLWAIGAGSLWLKGYSVIYIGASASIGENGAGGLGWRGGGGFDTVLYRDDVGVLAQRADDPQTFRVYNIAAGADYEFGKLGWESNVWKIGTEKGGAGVARGLTLQTDGVDRLTISAAGAATFSNTVKTLVTTVASLPAAATAGAGARAFVTDANAIVFLSVVAGGGTVNTPVVSNGTNWVIG